MSEMLFSKEICVNIKTVKYSYCGKLLAFGRFDEITIVRVDDKVLLLKSLCSGLINAINWSVNSNHVLCVISHKNLVQVFSLKSARCICIIREGPLGLQSAAWSPRACHIVTVSQFAERIAVWSLLGRSVGFIETPLMKGTEALSFGGPAGKYLAVVLGDFHDYNISIFSTTSWTSTRTIKCSNKINVPSAPLWSPDGLSIAIWETVSLWKSQLEIYSAKDGTKVGHFEYFLNDGKPTGICSVAWSPNAQFLMVACNDGRIYVLNYITWNVIYTFQHHKILNDENCQVFHIDSSNYKDTKFTRINDRPLLFTSIMASHNFLEVSNLSFSSDGTYMASQSKLMPAVVWLWDIRSFSLHTVIILRKKVTDLKWSFSKSKLLICTKSNEVVIWSPDGLKRINPTNSLVENDILIEKVCLRPCAIDEQEHFLAFTSSSMYIISEHNDFCY